MIKFPFRTDEPDIFGDDDQTKLLIRMSNNVIAKTFIRVARRCLIPLKCSLRRLTSGKGRSISARWHAQLRLGAIVGLSNNVRTTSTPMRRRWRHSRRSCQRQAEGSLWSWLQNGMTRRPEYLQISDPSSVAASVIT